MTKKKFLEMCDISIKTGLGIMVYVKIPGNKFTERIINHFEDVETKKDYYDKTYDDNMKHKHAPVEIVDIAPFELK